ncbi:MAG TPA: DoxX family protein [Anaerolineae bacterium]|nr:DoxX family protein [Anaerolineae bacterium]
MNIILWVLQIVFGLFFLFVGVSHFVLPPNLPAMMGWMYELPSGLHVVSGILEILGGLGLILPGLFRTQTRLTPLAALGLVFVMVGAAVWHLTRGEAQNVVQNLVIAALLGFVAYGRWKLSPLKDRNV